MPWMLKGWSGNADYLKSLWPKAPTCLAKWWGDLHICIELCRNTVEGKWQRSGRKTDLKRCDNDKNAKLNTIVVPFKPTNHFHLVFCSIHFSKIFLPCCTQQWQNPTPLNAATRYCRCQNTEQQATCWRNSMRRNEDKNWVLDAGRWPKTSTIHFHPQMEYPALVGIEQAATSPFRKLSAIQDKTSSLISQQPPQTFIPSTTAAQSWSYVMTARCFAVVHRPPSLNLPKHKPQTSIF